MTLSDKQSDTSKGRPAENDVYALAEPVPQTPREIPEIFLRRHEPISMAEPLPPPPKHPFFSGVHLFPWYLHTIGVWGLMAVGFIATGIGVLVCVWLADDGLGGMAVRCFALPVCWIGLLTISFASACLLEIVRQTADGYDKIIDWPAGNWRESMLSLQFTAGMFVPVALSVGGLKWLSGSWLLAVLVGFLQYPIFLLSAMESGSPLSPVSQGVLRTFRTHWRCWVVIYGQAGAMFGTWAALVVFNFPSSPWLTITFGSPTLAAALVIYFRLLGRLVWVTNQSILTPDYS